MAKKKKRTTKTTRPAGKAEAPPNTPSPKTPPKKTTTKPPRKRKAPAPKSERPLPPKPRPVIEPNTPEGDEFAQMMLRLAFEGRRAEDEMSPATAPERVWEGVTDPWQSRFLDVVAHTLNASAAAEFVGYTRQSVHFWIKQDAVFAAQYEHARQIAIDKLDALAYADATFGRAVPKFHKGEICGVVRERDTGLLKWLLSAHRRDVYGSASDTDEKAAPPPPPRIEVSGTIDTARVQLSAPRRAEGGG